MIARPLGVGGSGAALWAKHPFGLDQTDLSLARSIAVRLEAMPTPPVAGTLLAVIEAEWDDPPRALNLIRSYLPSMRSRQSGYVAFVAASSVALVHLVRRATPSLPIEAAQACASCETFGRP